LKKSVALVLGFVLLFSVMVGTASAATPLESSFSGVMGTPYKYGGTTSKGFDCSGFTRYVFAKFDIYLPHSSKGQASEGERVAKSDLRAGDLVFFNTGGSGISHVGIYLGDGVFVHSSTNKGVTKSRLSESYYANRYVTAARVLSDAQYNELTGN
jgi:cell wall-associated NlpC family hydrolase